MTIFQPLPTLLETGGPLLSMTQFLLLLAGASEEGLAPDLEMPPEALASRSPAFERDWHELLASIALLGPARAVLPTHLAAEVNIEPLIEIGVAEILVVDLTAELRRQIAGTYGQAFDRFRALEMNPVSTPLVSLNAELPRSEDRLEARMLAGDALYYLERLRGQIQPIVNGLRDIFGHYVDENQDAVVDALNGYSQATYPDPSAFEARDPGLRTEDLFEAMGLHVRDRALMEAEAGFSFPGISYTPDCLVDFDSLDRRLTSAPDGFAAFASLGMTMKQFDWPDFLAVHAFWSSFYELINMLRVSELTANPLYLPSRAVVRPSQRPAKQQGETGELLRMYRLFLAESRRLPSPTSLREVERLRRDPGLSSLRSMLAQWASASRDATEDDVAALKQIRRDIGDATARLKRAESLGRAGTVISLVSLPVAAYDLFKGSAFGAALAPIGPAINRYQARQFRKASWVRFGSP